MSYRPNTESLASRVIGFFALNPDEELSLDDIVSKFVEPGDSRNVHSQLIAACDHDMLVYTPEDDTYRKGPVNLLHRALDDGDDGTGGERIATRKARLIGSKQAAPKKATIFPPAIEEQRMDAIKCESKKAVEHQQEAGPFGVLWRIPARTPGAADEMDQAGVGGDTPALPNTHSAATGTPTAGQDTQGHPSKGIGAEASQARAHTKVRETHRLGTDGPRAPDPKSDQHWSAKEGLEARGGDRVGGAAWTDSAGEMPDGEKPSSAAHARQPGSIQPTGALGSGDGTELAARDPATGATQGANHASHQSADESAGESPIAAMRKMLMETLTDLRRQENPIPVDRARAIADVATVIVNSARVEVEYLRVTQQQRGQFFEALPGPEGEA